MSVFTPLIDDLIALWNKAGYPVVGGLAVLATLIIMGCAFVPNDPMAARLRSHLRRREQLRSEMLQQKSRTLRGRLPVHSLRALLGRLKLLTGEEAKRSTELLAQAGWRNRDALPIFLMLRLSLPLILGVAALFLCIADDMTAMHRLIATVLAVIAGAYSPTLYLKRKISSRQGMMRLQLPDALDLLVICVESGLGLDAALQRVVRELGTTSPQLADELGLTAVELNFLPDRRQALQNLARRTGLASIRGVVNTLIQTERYGTPLAHALRVLANEFRDERMMKAEEKAARLPAVLTVPMILFILPTLFIVLLGPAIISVMAQIKH